LVAVDSHEHDEEGHISEDLKYMRPEQMKKRFRKFEEIKKEIIQPELIGKKDYKNLIICWGSNYELVKEAVRKINRDDLAILHFSQIYPLPENVEEYLAKTSRIIDIENNFVGQFGELLQLKTCYEITHWILKYSGMQFSVEELIIKIRDILEEK